MHLIVAVVVSTLVSLSFFPESQLFGAPSTGSNYVANTLKLPNLLSKNCLGTDGSGLVQEGTCTGGGGSGGGTWATTTSTVAGRLINYSLNATDIVTIGSNSTTTAEFWFDPNTLRSVLGLASTTAASGNQFFSGDGSTSNPGFTFTSDPDVGIFRAAADTLGLAGTNVTIESALTREGDADTSVTFSNDQMTFTAGGVNLFDLVEAVQDIVNVNPSSADVDFIVETSGQANAFSVLGSDGTIDFGAYNCSGNANGGALTVDSSGNVVCTDDDSGGGGGATFGKAWEVGGVNGWLAPTTTIGTIVSASSTFTALLNVADLFATGGVEAVGNLEAAGNLVLSGAASELSLGAAGAIFQQDGDGALTIVGNGDGSGENHLLTINLDDTLNEIDITSSSATQIDWGSLYLVTSGRVGIGLTNPSEALHIYKGTGEFTTMRIDSGSTQGYFWAYDGDDSVNIGANSDAQLNFKQNNATRGYISDATGNWFIQNSEGDDSIFTLSAPVADPQEATFTSLLDHGSGNTEFIDWTLENYGTDWQGSINIAKAGTGSLRPFSLRFWNSDLGNIAANGVYSQTWLPNGTIGFGVSTSTAGTSGAGSLLYAASSTVTNLLKIDAAPGTTRLSLTSAGLLTVPNASTTDFTIANMVQVPYETIGFTYATSSWTGTTTLMLGPAAGAQQFNSIQCETTTGTVNVSIYDGTNRMNLFNASTTIGTVGLSTNNTFTKGESRRVDIGTPASTPVKLACTVKYQYLDDL